MGKCKGNHFFHKECLQNLLDSNCSLSLECPYCKEVYGTKTGQMPAGVMSWRSTPFKSCTLEGVEDAAETILVKYEIPSQQGFYGTSRQAFLPGNQEGVEVLSLLAECFRRKLTFAVGTSLTNGMENCVVWAGIHHKTNRKGGVARHGFPDPIYLARVREEIKERGVTLEVLEGKLEDQKIGRIEVK